MAASPPARQDPAAQTAVDELARDDYKRRKFLTMVGGTGAAGALSVLIAACGSDSSTTSSATSTSTGTTGSTGSTASSAPPADTFGEGDLGIVNYALTLEYLEADFYQQVVDSGLFKGSKYLPTLQKFGEEEAEHVAALEKVAKSLGKPAAKPKSNFSAALKSADTVVMNAAIVENVGAAAYLGQAGNIQSKEILASALAIHTVEARHAAVLNQVLSPGTFQGKDKYSGILPDGAFGVGDTAEAILKVVTPFIAS